jgi:putative tricarboxylic transport membrane protein
MFQQAITDLWHGFGVAIEPHNLMWAFFGVVVGNMVGVLPGLGALSAISILLPLTFVMHAVPALMMLSGIFYGCIYGGAIGAILLNLPTHPPHAVTCIEGYPLTKQGKGGTALGIAMLASFFAASVGILVMIFFSPLLVKLAFKFGPSDVFSVMLLGLTAGATMSGGPAIQGIAMTLIGMLCGVCGTDVSSGAIRFTFGLQELADGVGLVAMCMGLFGVADFLLNVNRMRFVGSGTKVRFRDMRPSKAELRQSFAPMLRGTLIGTLFGALPGTGPTVTTFIAYALERKIARNPERFGRGAIEGVASPEASSHAKTQVDFIPTLCLGIPGDSVMALLLGALMIQGIAPGPQLISEHPDLFWGLIASFWIGNVLLLVLNVPLIGVWVKLLQVPYRYLFPSALFFIAVGVFSTTNSVFQVIEVLFFGVAGAVFLKLRLPLTPILLGFVLGPMVEENFTRALQLSHGDLMTFIYRPISAFFIAVSIVLVGIQMTAHLYRLRRRPGDALVNPHSIGPEPAPAPISTTPVRAPGIPTLSKK